MDLLKDSIDEDLYEYIEKREAFGLSVDRDAITHLLLIQVIRDIHKLHQTVDDFKIERRSWGP